MSIRATLNLTRVGLVVAGRQFVAVLCLAIASYWVAPSDPSGAIGDPLTEVGVGINPQPIQLWLVAADILVALALAATTSRSLAETALEMRRAAVQRDRLRSGRTLAALLAVLVLAAAACAITGLVPPSFKSAIGSNAGLERLLECGWSAVASIGLAFFASNARAAFRALY